MEGSSSAVAAPELKKACLPIDNHASIDKDLIG